MRTAWLNLVALGSVTALIATACVIKTDGDDDDDETGGRRNSGGATSVTGGRGGTASGGAGTGGRSSGGTSSGGTKTTGGSSSTGGSSGTGGKAPTPYCDGKGPASDPAPSCDYAESDLESPIGECLGCLSENCCLEIRNCHGMDPNGEVIVNQCGADGTEYLCYQDCLHDKAVANGFYDPESDPIECAAECVRTGCSTIGDFTNDMIACMHDSCEVECFEP